MKRFNLTICFFLFFFLFAACERPDYEDEIEKTYQEAKRLSTSGAVIDGNMWSAKSMSSLDWEEAVAYCRNLKEFDHSDWRLPTINELRTLIRDCPKTEKGGSCGLTDECLLELLDDEKYNSTCDKNSDCSCKPRYYDSDDNSYSKLDDWEELWSSIPTKYQDNSAWYVDFSNGSIYQSHTRYSPTYYVRCVR